jgi:predicted RNase H-like nuclease (RuvC/YqgF family)
MNKSFEDWVESMVEDKPKGMSVGPKLHPVTHYLGREAAKMAWDAQQKKINDLQEKVDSLKAENEALKDQIDELEDEVGGCFQ